MEMTDPKNMRRRGLAGRSVTFGVGIGIGFGTKVSYSILIPIPMPAG